MRQLILSALLSVFCCTALLAQFPLMGLNGDVVYLKPITKRFAIGSQDILHPQTRLLVSNGQIEVLGQTSGEFLRLATPDGKGVQLRQHWQNEVSLTDWSPLSSDSLYDQYFSYYRFANTDRPGGLRLYRGNDSSGVATQLGINGSASFFQDGNVGFGTTTPTDRIHIEDGALLISNQTDNGNSQLHLGSNQENAATVRASGSNGQLSLIANRIELGGEQMPPTLYLDNYSRSLLIATDGEYRQLPYGYSLGTSGKILCTELSVALTANWPDYVFGPSYQRLTFAELASFIRENRHLPGLPSAAAVAEAGKVDVGEMQRVLLEKVEELTLYVLDLKTENEDLKARIQLLEEQ